MKTEITTSGSAEEPLYTLVREDGETQQTGDLVEVRRLVKEWEELEYALRTIVDGLNLIAASVEKLRPGNKPSKEDLRQARSVRRRVNKAIEKGKLSGGLLLVFCAFCVCCDAQVVHVFAGPIGTQRMRQLGYFTPATPVRIAPPIPAYAQDGKWQALATNLVRLNVSLAQHEQEAALLGRLAHPDSTQVLRTAQLHIWIDGQLKGADSLQSALRNIEAEYALREFKAKPVL